jgi:hypothetical protein
MLQIISIPASSVPPAELKVILSDHLALDRARVFRRLFVLRFGLLAAVATIVSVLFPTMPAFARWFPPTMCLAPPIAVWIREWRLARRLAQRLDEKVVKSS